MPGRHLRRIHHQTDIRGVEGAVDPCPRADKTAQIDDIGQLSYGELERQANRLAQRLLGAQRGLPALMAMHIQATAPPTKTMTAAKKMPPPTL
mgnify:CR=1 FL=1